MSEIFPGAEEKTSAEDIPQSSDEECREKIGKEIYAVSAVKIETGERRIAARSCHEPVIGTGGPVKEQYSDRACGQEEDRVPQVVQEQCFRIRGLCDLYEERCSIDQKEAVQQETGDAEVIPEGIIQPVREE